MRINPDKTSPRENSRLIVRLTICIFPEFKATNVADTLRVYKRIVRDGFEFGRTNFFAIEFLPRHKSSRSLISLKLASVSCSHYGPVDCIGISAGDRSRGASSSCNRRGHMDLVTLEWQPVESIGHCAARN